MRDEQGQVKDGSVEQTVVKGEWARPVLRSLNIAHSESGIRLTASDKGKYS